MNRREKLTVLKNAAANVVRGGAAAMVAVALPPFLTRLMPADAFGAWSLVLQVSAYVGYLDFGVQTAVGRFVAYANENRDTSHRDGIVSTALATLGLAGMIGFVGTSLLAFFLPTIFRQMPPILVGDSRLALLLVGGSLAVGLPASVFNGVFVGLQRNEVPAVIIGGSRIFSAISLVFVVRHGGHLAQMGIAVAAVNLASYSLQYLAYRKMVPDTHASIRLLSRKTSRELFDYCLSLSIWSFSMILVSGLDLTLVGYFQFQSVAYYAAAASLIVFLAGLQNAIFSAMISSTSVLHARKEMGELGSVVVTATRYGGFILLVTGLPLILAAREILSLWLGEPYADRGVRILQILVAASIIRLAPVPYIMALIGTGEQRLVTITPLLEGISNLLVSIIAGYAFGAFGVAFGTLFGSIVGICGHLFYNIPRTTQLQLEVSAYIRDGLLRPIICSLPVIVCVVAAEMRPLSAEMVRYLSVAAALTTGFLVWRWGLVESERKKLRPIVGQA